MLWSGSSKRGISRREVLEAIAHGEVIERYPGRQPYQSFLVLGVGEQPLHVIAAVDQSSETCHVVTVYRPDLEHFEADFKTRRRS